MTLLHFQETAPNKMTSFQCKSNNKNGNGEYKKLFTKVIQLYSQVFGIVGTVQGCHKLSLERINFLCSYQHSSGILQGDSTWLK